MKFKRSVVRKKPVNTPEYIPEINRSELARMLGVDRAHVSRILSGKIRPKSEMVGRIAKAVGVSVGEMRMVLDAMRLVGERP